MCAVSLPVVANDTHNATAEVHCMPLPQVAKDKYNNRDCHVFDCGHMAADIIATMGQAFELRFKSFLKKENARAPSGGGGGRRGGGAFWNGTLRWRIVRNRLVIK